MVRLEELARHRHTSVCQLIISRTRQSHDKRHLPHVESHHLKTLLSLKLATVGVSNSHHHSCHQEANSNLTILTIGRIRRQRSTDHSASSSHLVSTDTRKGDTDKEATVSRVVGRAEVEVVPDEECEFIVSFW